MTGADAAMVDAGSEGGGRGVALDQATLFRAVENANIPVITSLLRQSTIDVNAVNDDGVNALILAVYKYEQRRSCDVVKLLLESGADPTSPVTSERRICIVKQPASGSTSTVGLGNDGSSIVSEQHSTRKISLTHTTPLLVALELKSALYLKGWEYRHWDAILSLLAAATEKTLEDYFLKQSSGTPAAPVAAKEPPSSAAAAAAAAEAAAAVAAGWRAVLESGKHETMEVWAEGKHMEVLKLLLITNSKVLHKLVEAGELQGVKGRLELKDTSFTLLKEIVAYLYTGHLDHSFARLRGVDLLLVAHKYRIRPLEDACVAEVEANADNWVRLVTVGLEVKAPSLVHKVAKSIGLTLEGRQMWRGESAKPVFSENITPPAGRSEPVEM